MLNTVILKVLICNNKKTRFYTRFKEGDIVILHSDFYTVSNSTEDIKVYCSYNDYKGDDLFIKWSKYWREEIEDGVLSFEKYDGNFDEQRVGCLWNDTDMDFSDGQMYNLTNKGCVDNCGFTHLGYLFYNGDTLSEKWDKYVDDLRKSWIEEACVTVLEKNINLEFVLLTGNNSQHAEKGDEAISLLDMDDGIVYGSTKTDKYIYKLIDNKLYMSMDFGENWVESVLLVNVALGNIFVPYEQKVDKNTKFGTKVLVRDEGEDVFKSGYNLYFVDDFGKAWVYMSLHDDMDVENLESLSSYTEVIVDFNG